MISVSWHSCTRTPFVVLSMNPIVLTKRSASIFLIRHHEEGEMFLGAVTSDASEIKHTFSTISCRCIWVFYWPRYELPDRRISNLVSQKNVHEAFVRHHTLLISKQSLLTQCTINTLIRKDEEWKSEDQLWMRTKNEEASSHPRVNKFLRMINDVWDWWEETVFQFTNLQTLHDVWFNFINCEHYTVESINMSDDDSWQSYHTKTELS